MKNLKMKSARAALDLSQQQLADLLDGSHKRPPSCSLPFGRERVVSLVKFM